MDEPRANEPLNVVAEKIAVHARKADDQVISAAMLLKEARQRVEAGEAGEITWYEWASKNIELSLSRLRELQRIASAEDPRRELERQRKLTQKRVETHRAKMAGGAPKLERERLELISWAKTAPLKRVRQLLSDIGSEPDHAAALMTQCQPAAGERQAA